MASRYDSPYRAARLHVHRSSRIGCLYRQSRSGSAAVPLQAEWPPGLFGNNNGDGLVFSKEPADGSEPRQFETISGHQVGISPLHRHTTPGSSIRAEPNV